MNVRKLALEAGQVRISLDERTHDSFCALPLRGFGQQALGGHCAAAVVNTASGLAWSFWMLRLGALAAVAAACAAAPVVLNFQVRAQPEL